MKNFFEYDVNSPQERKERFEQYPELSRFYIALSEELQRDEYEKFYEAEKQSYFTPNLNAKPDNRKKTHAEIKWIH
jgi:hypothetical protein